MWIIDPHFLGIYLFWVCDTNMVQAQVTAYEIDHAKKPTMTDLVAENYLKPNQKCPNGNIIQISANGEVTASAPPSGE